MKPFLLFVSALLLCPFSFGQLQDVAPPKTDVGELANGTYSNQCLGFSYRPPQGWAFTADSQSKAVRLNPSKLGLFRVEHKQEDSHQWINFLSYDNRAQASETQRYISAGARSFVNERPEDREVLADSRPVTIAGKQFYRADAQSQMPANKTMYLAYIATSFRGFFLTAIITADSRAGLDVAVNALRGLSFQDDGRDPLCTLSEQPRELGGRLVGGRIDPAVIEKMMPKVPKADVQLTEAVTKPMLVEKTPPIYPDWWPRDLHCEVVVDVLVGKDGKIIRESTIRAEGNQTLVRITEDAVMKWKYQPYLVNGEPVVFETQVSLNVQAPPK